MRVCVCDIHNEDRPSPLPCLRGEEADKQICSYYHRELAYCYRCHISGHHLSPTVIGFLHRGAPVLIYCSYTRIAVIDQGASLKVFQAQFRCSQLCAFTWKWHQVLAWAKFTAPIFVFLLSLSNILQAGLILLPFLLPGKRNLSKQGRTFQVQYTHEDLGLVYKQRSRSRVQIKIQAQSTHEDPGPEYT